MVNEIKIGDWVPTKEQNIVKYDGKLVIIPFDEYFNQSGDQLNTFLIKRDVYTKELPNICKNINYFIEFYDEDDELLLAYLRMKFLIDARKKVFKKSDDFIRTLYETVMTDTIIEEIRQMVEDNYLIDVEKTSSENGAAYSEVLKYTNEHSKILLMISTAMKILVPLIYHYINTKNASKEEFMLFECYAPLFNIFGQLEDGTNIYDKLYMTAMSRIKSNYIKNIRFWRDSEIYGDDPVVYIDNLLKQRFVCEAMFKYNFEANIISYNSTVMDNQLNYFNHKQFDFNSMELSNEVDESGLSKVDKMEMAGSKLDESMVILSSINTKNSIKRLLKQMRVLITDEEIEFYKKHYKVNYFQSQLVLYFYAKYFGGFRDLHLLNKTQYITLLILLKRRLQIFGNVYLPQLLTGNIVGKLNTRTIRNDKFISKVKSSDLFEQLMEGKFNTVNEIGKSDIIINRLSILLNTTFTFVDYDHPELLGEKIEVNSDMLCDEFLNYLNQI